MAGGHPSHGRWRCLTPPPLPVPAHIRSFERRYQSLRLADAGRHEPLLVPSPPIHTPHQEFAPREPESFPHRLALETIPLVLWRTDALVRPDELLLRRSP